MPTGLTPGWSQAEPDYRGAGRDEWARTTGIPPTHALVGGPGFGSDGSGFQADAGYQRTVLGDPLAVPAMPSDVTARWDDWRDAFDPDSPAFWILLFMLAAVGFVFLRVEGRAGPVGGSVSIGK